ncbi:50S ribosomal protein L22 [Candidatus Woesearchaeota archaeon]|nr:50S ribosomal protein L22 [Candidatus Woesearchaeota archaeon]
MTSKYAFQGFNKELMARAVGRDLSISAKQAIEICNYLRHRKLVQAKNLLQETIDMKKPIPFKRFTNGLGHRRGKLASGRFPVKASTALLKLLDSVEANAQTKGFNSSELEIVHMCAHKASSPVHYGRNYGREFKRTHVEVVVQETPKKEKGKKQEKKSEKPAKPAAEAKPVEKKQEAPAPETKKKPEAGGQAAKTK